MNTHIHFSPAAKPLPASQNCNSRYYKDNEREGKDKTADLVKRESGLPELTGESVMQSETQRCAK